MPSDESKGSQLDAIGSLAQRQLDNTGKSSRPVRFSNEATRAGKVVDAGQSPRTHDDNGIFRCQIRPMYWDRPQSPSTVLEVEPLFAPVLPPNDELVLLAHIRVEWMRYPKTF